MTQFVRNENGDVIAVTDDDPRATGDAIGASLKQQGIYQSPDGWAIVTGSPGGQLGGAPRIITEPNGKQPPADVIAKYPMASPQENAGFQQQAAKYRAGEGKGMSLGQAALAAVASYFGASALGGLVGGAGAAGANIAGGVGDWGGIPGASGTSNLGALSTGADASWGVNPAGTTSNMTVGDPWGAGNATNLSTLTEGPSTLSGMSGNVLDTVAPAASGVGASGAALPAGWQSALGVEGAAPLLSNASTLGGLGSAASTAASASSKGSAISRILDGTATAADYLSVGGAALPGILGAVTSSKQADNLKALADQYSGYGAPSRARYEASFQPGFTMENDPGYKDALDMNAKTTLHALSVNGNPAGSPNAWEASQKDLYDKTEYPALQAYRNTNSVAGGLASGASAAPNLATQAIQQQGTTMADLGGAARDVFAPTSTIDDLLKKLKTNNNIFAVQ